MLAAVLQAWGHVIIACCQACTQILEAVLPHCKTWLAEYVKVLGVFTNDNFPATNISFLCLLSHMLHIMYYDVTDQVSTRDIDKDRLSRSIEHQQA